MISKQDILERAREWQLRPEVVEKDYVLGWLLTAIAQHDETSETWVLKGGTCVKKCFFETYRFSEDLDFSLMPEALYTSDELREVIREVTGIAHDLSGIEFSDEALSIRSRVDKQGRETFEGKVGYRGPLAVPGWPRVLLDLTRHEPIVDEPVLRPVLHPYPDPLPDDASVRTYSIEELIAEKTRALFERARPRDLYDVVYIVQNEDHEIELSHAGEVFREKCQSKSFEPPTLSAFVSMVEGSAELRAEWQNMLGHQLPALPPIDGPLSRLRDAIAWIEPAAVPPTELAVLARAAGETAIMPPSVRLWGTGVPLESVRFAGANLLLVSFYYSGKPRMLEPYSLRRSNRGNILLYGWELESGQIKAFDVAKIQQLRTTHRTFVPRYRVEFGGAGSTVIPALAPRQGRTVWRGRTSTRRKRGSGPVYVFTCPVCQREFRHSSNDATLRRHKSESGGWYCSERRGYFTRTE